MNLCIQSHLYFLINEIRYLRLRLAFLLHLLAHLHQRPHLQATHAKSLRGMIGYLFGEYRRRMQQLK